MYEVKYNALIICIILNIKKYLDEVRKYWAYGNIIFDESLAEWIIYFRSTTILRAAININTFKIKVIVIVINQSESRIYSCSMVNINSSEIYQFIRDIPFLVFLKVITVVV